MQLDFQTDLETIFDSEDPDVREGSALLIRAFQNEVLVGWILGEKEPMYSSSIFIKDLVGAPSV